MPARRIHTEGENMTIEQLLTSKQVAAMLGVTHGRIRQLTKSTGIGTKIGSAWIFRPADVEALRNRQTSAGRPANTSKQENGANATD